MISDETSMNNETTPSAMTVRGIAPTAVKPGEGFILSSRAISRTGSNRVANEASPTRSLTGNLVGAAQACGVDRTIASRGAQFSFCPPREVAHGPFLFSQRRALEPWRDKPRLFRPSSAL